MTDGTTRTIETKVDERKKAEKSMKTLYLRVRLLFLELSHLLQVLE
jgi:hypothetical protein